MPWTGCLSTKVLALLASRILTCAKDDADIDEPMAPGGNVLGGSSAAGAAPSLSLNHNSSDQAAPAAAPVLTDEEREERAQKYPTFHALLLDPWLSSLITFVYCRIRERVAARKAERAAQEAKDQIEREKARRAAGKVKPQRHVTCIQALQHAHCSNPGYGRLTTQARGAEDEAARRRSQARKG